MSCSTDESTKNRSRYYLKDNLFNFWYSFVPDNMFQIAAGRIESLYRNEVGPRMSHYMGKAFEEICRQYLLYHAEDLPFPIREIGGWWGGNPRTKVREEIDVLAYSGKSAIFGECKWSSPVDVSVLKELRRKAELFPGFDRKYYYLFSRSGYTSDAVREAEEDDSVRLITLEEIYGRKRIWHEE